MSLQPRRRLLLACLLLGCAALAPAQGRKAESPGADDWRAIRQVIDQQIRALKEGDGVKALQYATPGVRRRFRTPEQFLHMVRAGYTPLLTAQYTVYIDGANVDGATIQPLRLVLADNTVLVALYQMERQRDGQWRIAGCVLAPSTVQAT